MHYVSQPPNDTSCNLFCSGDAFEVLQRINLLLLNIDILSPSSIRERSHAVPRREVPAQSEPHHGAEFGCGGGGSGGGCSATATTATATAATAATAATTASPSTTEWRNVDDASCRRHEREQLAVPRLQRRHDRFHGCVTFRTDIGGRRPGVQSR